MREDFEIPEESLRLQSQKDDVDKLVVAAAVTRSNRLLLVRRSPHVFMGGLYEIPGGAVEDNETIKMALTREVKEEVGLDITEVVGIIDGFDYCENSGRRVRQFNFVVEVADIDVRLIPSEHDQYIWITRRSLNLLDLSDKIAKVVESFFAFQVSRGY